MAERIRQRVGEGEEGGEEGRRGGGEEGRRRLIADAYRPTVLTRVFSGRPARGFHNEMVAAFIEKASKVLPLVASNRSCCICRYLTIHRPS